MPLLDCKLLFCRIFATFGPCSWTFALLSHGKAVNEGHYRLGNGHKRGDSRELRRVSGEGLMIRRLLRDTRKA